MKIVVASFQCESNSRAKLHPQKSDFEYFVGEDIFKKLVVKDVFTDNGFEVIPSIYANALPSATVERSIYEYYVEQILDTVRNNPDADGIYIYVHGSMEVCEIGSGELYLLKQIRKIVPPTCLIALTMDLHANITDEFGDYADIICGYKTAPHVDQPESQVRAAKALVYCLKNGVKPYTYVQKIPMLVKGDTMLTANEPLRSLEEETRLLEKDDLVFGANMFFGHCWIDAPNTSALAVVSAADKKQAERIAKDLANKLWSTRKEYKFLIEAEAAEECVRRAIEGKERRIFITDSGDNTTAGSEGDRVDILKILLEAKPPKKTCVAGITNKDIIESFWKKSDGDEVSLNILGDVRAKIKAHGEILGWAKEIIGRSLTFSIGNVDVIFTELRSAFIEKGNFDAHIRIKIIFEDKAPYDKVTLDLPAERTTCLRLDYPIGNEKYQIPFGQYALHIISDVPVCACFGRLDVRQSNMAYYSLAGYAF